MGLLPISIVEKLLVFYEKQPILRGLVQLIQSTPSSSGSLSIGSALDAGLMTMLANIKEDRMKTFFDELSQGKVELNAGIIQSEDFLHCYFATAKAAINTRRRQKIRIFARLLKSSFRANNFTDTDEYEEYLEILDDLSYYDLLVLTNLEEFESKFPKNKGENDLQRASRFWKPFIEQLEKQIGISKDEINDILNSLNRTGCYETFVGGYLDYTGGQGKLTFTYFRLKKLIEDENGKIIEK